MPGVDGSFNKSDTSKEDAVMMYIENYYFSLTKSMVDRKTRSDLPPLPPPGGLYIPQRFLSNHPGTLCTVAQAKRVRQERV